MVVICFIVSLRRSVCLPMIIAVRDFGALALFEVDSIELLPASRKKLHPSTMLIVLRDR